ncbi:MAG: DUF721 domain-containing protein [Bacillota bacterium]
MVRLREALDGSLKRFGILRQARRARAVDLWAEVVGSAAARASRATRCKDGVLFVAVKSSVWAHELSLLKADIIKKLNRYLGKGTIVDIRFQARGFLKAGARDRCSTGSGGDGGAARPGRRLSHAEMEEIDTLSAAIADPEVRAAFARAVMAARMENQEQRAPTGPAQT